MSTKSKGTNAERELVHMFWSTSPWTAIRVAGSGSNKYPSPDILASNSLRKLAIEAKITKDKYKHFSKEEIADLEEFSKKFGAEPLIAIKFNRDNWYFITLNNLQKTENNYSISLESAKEKGISFSELIK